MRLENNLPHQLNAINAVCGVFAKAEFQERADKSKCARMVFSASEIKSNIAAVQNGNYYTDDYTLPAYYKNNYTDNDYLNIDVKMETGTGKTYVYTRTMFELHKHYGINKFIVLVPTVSIKEGAKAFLTSSYMRTDLQALYGGARLCLHVLDPQKTVKGRKMFPSAIADFANATDVGGNRIDVLLMNSGMLTSKATMGANYDQTLLGVYNNPYDTLREIAPFVIIDEPHKFSREQRTFKCLIENIKPQCVIRYGATFPEVSKGVFDYENVVYNLGSCDSFNGNLIKGVEVEYIAEEEKMKEQAKIKVLSITANRGTVKTARLQNELTKKAYDFTEGQALSEIDESLDGITVCEIAKGVVTLSNGMELRTGDSIYPQVFGETYQRTMLRLALERHFEKEKKNFMRLNKIKTLSLFFIDNIESFRDEGHLRVEFEELLREKIKSELKKLSASKRETEYKAYLEYSLAHIPETIAAYFSEDNGTDSEEIKREVDKVLREKDKIIRIRDDEGNFEPTRFIFSKWTLKEGWDNPNVFVIAKLRSSGSETSKLQEVGRGLRLPVDEYGNRISDEQFYLRYIIDFSEKDFADRLKKEINGDSGFELKITSAFLTDYAKRKHINVKEFMRDLVLKNYIELPNYDVIEENRESFIAEYPDLFKALKNGKVIDVNGGGSSEKLAVRKYNFEKLESLWAAVNGKYYLRYGCLPHEQLIGEIKAVLEKGIDGASTVTTKIAASKKDEKDGSVEFESKVGTSLAVKNEMSYSSFLKEVRKLANIPPDVMHRALCEHFKGKTVPEKFFGKQTLKNFIEEFRRRFVAYYEHRFDYEKIPVEVKDSFRDGAGNLKESVLRSGVGVLSSNDAPPKNYLYDGCAYDSQLEKVNIVNEMSSNKFDVEAFGKIPKRTVRIPTYADGTYSPDFIYSLRLKDGSQVGAVSETKNKGELSPEEKRKIACAEKLFAVIGKEKDGIIFVTQTEGQSMLQVLENAVK
jgi:type III restriction enzyme